MQSKIARSFLITIVLLVLASFIPLATAYNYTPFLSDDSYITLAYAKNLVLGHGFVFNHPPATLGTTTPLFTMIVAALAFVLPTLGIRSVAVFFTAFCWLGIVWILYFFRKAWGLEDWQAGIVGLVVIASGWVGFLGMEAYLFAFLLVLSTSLYFSNRLLMAGLASGLLFLTRGEGVLVLAALLIAGTIQQYHKGNLADVQFAKRVLRIVAGFAIPVLLWFLYAHYTFGSFLPNTLATKQAQGQSGLWPSFWQSMTRNWMPAWGRSFDIPGLSFLNVWWIVSFVGLVAAGLKRRRWLVFAGWISLYVLGYAVLNVSAYDWYQLPIQFVLNLFFALGIIEIVETTMNRLKPKNFSVGTSVLVAGLLLSVLAIPTVGELSAHEGDIRGRSYVGLSLWLRENTRDTASIAYIEIGYLGYYTDNRIVDLAGLTSPDIVSHIAKKDFAWGFWHYRPDYYVSLPDFDWALAGIRTDPRFDQYYRPVASLPGPGSARFTIYERVGE
jgi:arabinofuranosyltransferase